MPSDVRMPCRPQSRLSDVADMEKCCYKWWPFRPGCQLRAKACMPFHAQAEMSTAVDDAHEDHRIYLITRLLPAVTHLHAIATGIATGNSPAPSRMLESMAVRVMHDLQTRTTAELEDRMSELYDRLLLVRIARIAIFWSV